MPCVNGNRGFGAAGGVRVKAWQQIEVSATLKTLTLGTGRFS